MLWEQFMGPSLKAMRTVVIRPLQGYGNTASLSYPDTWARKPDCFHLPYIYIHRKKDITFDCLGIKIIRINVKLTSVGIPDAVSGSFYGYCYL